MHAVMMESILVCAFSSKWLFKKHGVFSRPIESKMKEKKLLESKARL